jgi:tetratricopeptide (TPR) repeat protein
MYSPLDNPHETISHLLQAGHRDAAIRLLAETLKDDPNDDEAWYLLGDLLDEKDRKIYAFEHFLASNPNHIRAKDRITSYFWGTSNQQSKERIN